MNWSIYSADRNTHLKIVVVGLSFALLVAVIGLSAHQFNLGTDIMATACRGAERDPGAQGHRLQRA